MSLLIKFLSSCLFAIDVVCMEIVGLLGLATALFGNEGLVASPTLDSYIVWSLALF